MSYLPCLDRKIPVLRWVNAKPGAFIVRRSVKRRVSKVDTEPAASARSLWLELLAEARGERATNSRFVKKAERSATFGPEEAMFGPEEAMFGPEEAMFAPAEAMFGPEEAMFAPAEAMFAPDEATFAPAEAMFAPDEATFFPSTLTWTFAKSLLKSLLRVVGKDKGAINASCHTRNGLQLKLPRPRRVLSRFTQLSILPSRVSSTSGKGT